MLSHITQNYDQTFFFTFFKPRKKKSKDRNLNLNRKTDFMNIFLKFII